MMAVIRNLTYAKLFGAQIIALLGTGLLTVVTGLLAFEIAGGDVGVVVSLPFVTGAWQIYVLAFLL